MRSRYEPSHAATSRSPAWQSAGVQNSAAEGLLGLLHPAWQALIAICLLVVTLLGLRRLASRGPARVTNALFFTGFLILAVTVVGTLAVSCSDSAGRGSEPGSSSP
jgi:hypothetical protein